MRTVYTVVATLWLAAVVIRANESPPDHCCPYRFEVDPDPNAYHFRCEEADLTAGCDGVTMTESVPNTAINTQGGGTACNNYNSYLMTDPNWQDQQTFQPNVACAYKLPALPTCCWQLYLVKDLDPLVCGDTCWCDCEDHVHFKKFGASTGESKYCDSQGNWCGPFGPHNVANTATPFHAGVNTGVMTTFRSDNTNGAGEGALVFAYAVPCSKKRSVRQEPTTKPTNLENSEYCRKLYDNKEQDSKFLCDCYNNTEQQLECYLGSQQQITRSLYDIFTDNTGNAAQRYHDSPTEVLRRAARHAVVNIRRFGRAVPTYTQLRQQDSSTSPQPTPTGYPGQ